LWFRDICNKMGIWIIAKLLHVSRQNIGQIIVLTNCCQNVYLQFIVI
jgi:hypothetical protein